MKLGHGEGSLHVDDVFDDDAHLLVEIELGRGRSSGTYLTRSEAVRLYEHLGTALRIVPGSEPLPEWQCPSCGATIRARMADSDETRSADMGAFDFYAAGNAREEGRWAP